MDCEKFSLITALTSFFQYATMIKNLSNAKERHMQAYITPNDTIRQSDAESILAAIFLAKETGTNCVRIPRRNERTGENLWVIESAISLPSDMEVIIDDAHLILAEGSYTNMFTVGSPEKNTARDEICNVTLRGEGNAILDGGVYNGLSEKNSCQDGHPHIVKNTTLLFFNCSNLRVENLSLINQRWWAITNIFVHHAVYRNIHFEADFSRIDENGAHHPDQYPTKYKEVYIKNADGIDLRVGCHDILIENVSGFTEDDSVALTALGKFEQNLGYFIEDGDTDIHDVRIQNVATESFCANVRLLNDNGFKLYNVTVDGVHGIKSPRTFQNNSAVRIGDMIYAQSHSTLGDTHHITVRNVISESKVAVSLCKGLVDSIIENVTVLNGAFGVAAFKDYEATLLRCEIRNILTPTESAVAFCPDRITFVEE